MKVLVWGINYAPEVTGIGPCNAALCEHLRAAGHEVEMVTTFPYYPAWKKSAEDSRRLWRTDFVNGVPVHRCWHYVPARVRWWRRILHEVTFLLTSLPRVLRCRVPDVIVAVSPPLLLGPGAWLAARLMGTRYVFHVQDLQPDAAVGLGMLRPGLFTRALYAVEAFSYRHAWRVSGISRGMLAAFTAKGVPAARQLYFPNGTLLAEPCKRGAFRVRHGFTAGDFLAIYSGNFGVKQGLGVLVEAARRLLGGRVKIILCGDGAQREIIAAQAAGLANVHLLPLLPEQEYREMLADADVAIITQAAGSGRAFFPSKLLPTLAAARRLLSVADAESELALAVAESGCGVNILPDCVEALSAALTQMATDPAALDGYARAGRAWVQQFEQSAVLGEFTRALAVK